MKTTISNSVDNMVQSMRQIRDKISYEIKDMTFGEEREFLDNLLRSDKIETKVLKHSGSESKSS